MTTVGHSRTPDSRPTPRGGGLSDTAFAPAPHPCSPHAEVVLSARDLTLEYDTSTKALRGVSLAIEAGESLAIMGPSGCGKSTLLHTLAGILQPTSGTVQYRDTDLSTMRDAQRTRLRRTDFGFVFQDGQLLDELTAAENVMLPRMLAGRSRSAAKTSATRWLDALGLEGLGQRRPGQLSGGQAQRVAIARALAGEPTVVFADEPTGALDQASGRDVLAHLLQATQHAGASLVMATHDVNVAQACSRTVLMRDGVIVEEFRK